MEAAQIVTGAVKLASNKTFFKVEWETLSTGKIQTGQDTSARFPKCLLILNMHIFSKTKSVH